MAIFEWYDSRTEKISASGINATRVFISDWATRHADSPKIGDPYPDLSGVYCSDVQIEPYTWADDGSGHDPATGPNKAKIIATYSSSDRAQQQDDDFEAESLDFGGEMLAKGGGAWDSNGLPVKENDPGSVKYYPRAEYMKEMIIDDITRWAEKVYKATGKLNSTKHLGGAAETWLFQGADAVKFVNSNGEARWRMTFRFIYRDNGWNKCWRSDDSEVGGKWDEIYFVDEKGDQCLMYETTSFDTLLQR